MNNGFIRDDAFAKSAIKKMGSLSSRAAASWESYREEEEIRRAQYAYQLEVDKKIKAGELNPDGTEKTPGSNYVDQARLQLVQNAMKEDLSRDDLAKKAGIGDKEVDAYLEAAGNKDYKKQNAFQAVGSFFKDVGVLNVP